MLKFKEQLAVHGNSLPEKIAEYLLQESADLPAKENGLHSFLQDICLSRFPKTGIEKLRNLNKDSHNSVDTDCQLVNEYSTRREEVLQFLPEYTNHCTTVETIHEDLENHKELQVVNEELLKQIAEKEEKLSKP